jgi:hypothetical protein
VTPTGAPPLVTPAGAPPLVTPKPRTIVVASTTPPRAGWVPTIVTTVPAAGRAKVEFESSGVMSTLAPSTTIRPVLAFNLVTVPESKIASEPVAKILEFEIAEIDIPESGPP